MLNNKTKITYPFLILFAAAFLAITFKGFTNQQTGDENTYYYMGKLITEGKVPYRDFFYAHPPLHIYLIAAIYKIFGFNIFVLKLIPLISTLISAFFIFKIAKGMFGEIEAVISCLLFLFSYSVMFNSVFSFGIEIASMFLVIGIYFLFIKKNYILSGTFFALAGLTRLLALIPIILIIATFLLSSRRNFLKLSLAFFIIFLLCNMALILFFGNAYFNTVYKYHLLKSLGGRENFKEYIDVIKLNWILFSSALLLIFAKPRKLSGIFAVVSIIYMIFLITLKKIFGFYFIIIFPLLAIIGGYAIFYIFNKLTSKKLRHAVSVILLSIFFWNLPSDVVFLERYGFTGFSRRQDLAGFISLNSNENTMLFGDNSVVPLLALSTSKRIAFDFVDTNEQVFASGLADLKNVLNNLKGKEILFLIRSNQGISSFKEVQSHLNKECDFLSQFHDEIEGNFLVYRCK